MESQKPRGKLTGEIKRKFILRIALIISALSYLLAGCNPIDFITGRADLNRINGTPKPSEEYAPPIGSPMGGLDINYNYENATPMPLPTLRPCNPDGMDSDCIPTGK